MTQCWQMLVEPMYRPRGYLPHLIREYTPFPVASWASQAMLFTCKSRRMVQNYLYCILRLALILNLAKPCICFWKKQIKFGFRTFQERQLSFMTVANIIFFPVHLWQNCEINMVQKSMFLIFFSVKIIQLYIHLSQRRLQHNLVNHIFAFKPIEWSNYAV